MSFGRKTIFIEIGCDSAFDQILWLLWLSMRLNCANSIHQEDKCGAAAIPTIARIEWRAALFVFIVRVAWGSLRQAWSRRGRVSFQSTCSTIPKSRFMGRIRTRTSSSQLIGLIAILLFTTNNSNCSEHRMAESAVSYRGYKPAVVGKRFIGKRFIGIPLELHWTRSLEVSLKRF